MLLRQQMCEGTWWNLPSNWKKFEFTWKYFESPNYNFETKERKIIKNTFN